MTKEKLIGDCFDVWMSCEEPWNYDFELRAEGYDGEEVNWQPADNDVAAVEACLFGRYFIVNEGDRITFFADEIDNEKFNALVRAWEARGGSLIECSEDWNECHDAEQTNAEL